jgi:hypothetical protein
MSNSKKIERIAIAVFILMSLLLLIALIATQVIGTSQLPEFMFAIYRVFLLNAIPILTLGVTILACYFAYKIPFRIMQNQIYTDLMREYRSECMLENIDKIIRICAYRGKYRENKCEENYIKDCHVFHKCNKLQNCRKDENKKDIIKKSTWQNVSQWYWQLSNLLFTEEYFGSTKEIKELTRTNFTRHDSEIICIIYNLNRGLDKFYYNKESNSKFTELLRELFDESKNWKDNKR